MKKILVPTDFSPIADNAIDVAINSAKKNNSEVIVLHVVEEGSRDSYRAMGEALPSDIQQNIFLLKLLEKSRNQLAEAVGRVQDAGLTAKSELRLGNAFHGITSIIAEHDVDAVVMGTHGASGFQELLIGSNAEKVVRLAKCPVFCIHEKPKSGDFKNIVVATNMEDEEKPLFEVLKNVQKNNEATLHLVWINTPNNFERDKTTVAALESFAEELGLGDYTINVFNDISEEDGIVAFAEELDADAIALITHGRTGLAHLISGSIAEDVVNHTKRPVLTLSVKD